MSFQLAADGSFVARHASVRILSPKPRVTHDGVIWPMLRREMPDGIDLVRRMSYDLAGLIKQRGSDAPIMLDDYLRLGWDRHQVLAHAADAAGMLPEIRSTGLPLEAA